MKLENVADIYPLSSVQQGILFHALSAPDSGVYIQQYCCQIRGNLQVSEFKKAWQQVFERQPTLRTVFLWEELDEPLQIVRKQVTINWETGDWRGQKSTQQESELEAFLKRDRLLGFNLAQAPISRFRLIHLEEETYQFIWSFHHLLADGWSIPILWQEVLSCYQANCQGESPRLDPVRPYRDYIAWLQSQNSTSAEGFWRQQLQGFTEPTPLPTARLSAEPTVQPYRQQNRLLSPSLTNELKTLARQHRLTLNTLIQGAWALLLNHYSGEKQVAYGSVTSGRPTQLPGVESMVGIFINTLPVLVSVKPESSLIQWLQARQEELLNLRQYEVTPLSEIQRWSDLPPGRSLFDSIVVFENYPTPSPSSLNLGFEIENIRYLEQSNYPLGLLVVPGESLALMLLYDSGRFEESAIARLLDHLELLLAAFVKQPQIKLGQLPRLTAAEVQQLSHWQQIDYPQDRCIHQLIEAQVEKAPNALAVIYNGQQLTYSQLNQRANQLAHYLRSLGVKLGERVALGLHNSLEMVIGILGILKAGGVYIPLDPTYPAARLDYCLQDTAPKVLLTQRRISWPNLSVSRINLDETNPDLESMAITNLPNLASPEDLAYIIYTSGSTGQPKGVMVSHLNLMHSTTARSQVYTDPVERFLLLSSIAFDSSVAGLFWTLSQRGTLVLSPYRLEQDLDQLACLIADEQITHTLCVPTLYSLLIETAAPEKLASLHTIIVAGEACGRNMAQQHYAKLPQTRLYNEYGPTEASVWSTVYLVPPKLAPGSIPIGRPITNTQIYLLDVNFKPVPIGAVGEIYIGGDGVAQGYLNQPERIASAFIKAELISGSSLPFPSPTLYKTGDLACYQEDGNLVWLGRCDRQVKIAGHRIELGEIEEALFAHETVQETVVVAQSPRQFSEEESVESLVAALEALDAPEVEDLLRKVEAY